MTHPNPSRATRALVATVAALGTALVPAAGAYAAGAPAGSGATGSAGSAPSGSQSALEAQAQELAGQIQAAGRTLGQLSEELDAAQLRNQALTDQLRSVTATMGRTTARVTRARAQLRQQAVLAYVAGGNPAPRVVPGRAGLDPSLMVSYADIVARGQDQVVNAYRSALVAQSAQAAKLTTTRQAVTVSIRQLRSDRTAAANAAAARQAALALVKGQLATLVAAVEQSQQKAMETSVRRSLAQQNDLPPGRPPALASTTTPPTRAPAQPTPVTTRPAPVVSHPTPPTVRTVPPTVATAPPTTRPAPPPTTAPAPPPPPPPVSGVLAGAAAAVHYAYAQLGKPYQWAGAGPNSFDCSGLVMMAWAAGGVYFPHLAQSQYDMTERIPLSSLQPGDLVFFGSPSAVYHVGIYIGGGDMIDAPSTGQVVSISSIYWTDLLGAGRVT